MVYVQFFIYSISFHFLMIVLYWYKLNLFKLWVVTWLMHELIALNDGCHLIFFGTRRFQFRLDRLWFRLRFEREKIV